jgi:uncharacterized protein
MIFSAVIKRCPAACIIAVALCGLALTAHAATTIQWKHLLPQLPPLKDPLSGLTQDQRFDLETIAWVRQMTPDQRQRIEYKPGVEDAEKFERRFKQAGISVDELLMKYNVWLAEVRRRKELVNTSLDGQTVRLAGYLLPLEFSDEGVTDFLLVPYVGACIHVPPPPTNQIVFVRLVKKFKVQEVFTPVWVTGKLIAKVSSKALTLVDGTSKISVGYHMNGASAQTY